MFNLDTETGEITLPQGDTAEFIISLKHYGYGSLPEGTIAIFGVIQSQNTPIPTPVLTKAIDVKNNEVLVRLTNKDTRDLKPGVYFWDIRIVTDPDINDAGEVRADDPGDNVYSLFSGSSDMPRFVVTGVSSEV